MIPVSDEFLATLRRPHQQFITRADVLLSGNVVASDLMVESGSVTFDRNAKVRSRCDVTFAEPTLIPSFTDSPLRPQGFELALWRGLVLTDGTEELVPLGVFPIQSAEFSDPGLVTRVAGMDRTQRIIDARFQSTFNPFLSQAGTLFAATAIIEGEIDSGTWDGTGVLGLPYNISGLGVADLTDRHLIYYESQGDRWDALTDLCKSRGCEAFFDRTGVLTIRPVQDPATQEPVWDVDEGDDGVLIGLSVDFDRAQAYNRVVAVGEAPDPDVTPPRGVATDTDPSSPSYYDGPFGRKPRFYSSPLIMTNEQAASAAFGILVRSIGLPSSLSFSAVVNPALEVGDAVRVRRAASNVDEVHVLDTLTIPLTPEGEMTASTRSRQSEVTE